MEWLAKKVERKIRVCSREKIPCNISVDYIQDLYNRQEGKCPYTEKVINEENFSLHRIDPDDGYIIGNVIITDLHFNRKMGGLKKEEHLSVIVTNEMLKRSILK